MIEKKEERLAVFPGSFDPFTLGHYHILLRASKLFDKVYIAVAINTEKSPIFSLEERRDMITRVLNSEKENKNIEVVIFDGLITNFMKENNIKILVRGIRDIDDMLHESRMSRMNKTLYDKMETVFLHTNEGYAYISSALIKEIVAFGGPLENLVPKPIIEVIKNKFLS